MALPPSLPPLPPSRLAPFHYTVVDLDYYPASPQKSFEILFEKISDNSTGAADIFTLACFLAFGLFIGFDVWRAFKKRAIWLPSKAFALSGVTVQIIVWWTTLTNILPGYNKEIRDLVRYHSLVVCGRVAVCVFVAYLLPGMAAPSVRVFGALAVTICVAIVSELVLLYHPALAHGYGNGCIGNKSSDVIPEQCLRTFSTHTKSVDWDCMKVYKSGYASILLREFKSEFTWSRIADLILLICLVVLGLILCCTLLASKTIHSLLKQRISAIAGKSHFEKPILNFSITEDKEAKSFWNDFEDEVLRSWFVARVSRADYVISRSCFSSAVWVILTLCLIPSVKVIMSFYYEWFILLSPISGFILIGYVVISWRWLASLLYYPPICSWTMLCLEEFWTSRTLELISMYDLKSERQMKSKKSCCTNIFVKFRLHKLLYLVVMLQMCVVFFSKVCGIISKLTVGSILYFCCKFVQYFCPKCTHKENDQAESYTRILEILRMPGEDTSALWKANRMSLNKAKGLMEEGCKEGISCEEINSIFRSYNLQWEEKGAQLLKELKEKATPKVLLYFPSVEKHCLKMTVVSLVTILIGAPKAKSNRLTKVVKACHEVWDLLCFADECDIDLKADKIDLLHDLQKEKDQILLAADREFCKLQKGYPKLLECCVPDNEKVHEFLRNLLEECENILRKENLLEDDKESCKDLHDSREWRKIGRSYTLYKLCIFMLDKNNGIENVVEWVEESLRNVIACSLSGLPNIIVKQCWIWAQEFEEEKLWETIQLAGKCKGMMEEWGKDIKTVNIKQHKTLCHQLKKCIPCCTMEERPNQREQCRIEVNEPSS